ncbi:asparagine synthase (glutamine-hydrolyzing) [Singulisphaera sp. PoT]|uniref:asparagine synthase (glutamine-hydrolyzing) n=1 Tax=Singulisphaera sp. PoT TaxID=3411797 RepID=UPI003BF60A28
MAVFWSRQWGPPQGVALGARRLSIVDLVGGRQPISNERGNVWVAFNGELFEYPELREQLLTNGHELATRCDTEVWVHLYEDRGEGMFAETRGQFAVSLWDRDNETLILGRDRVGICPLYYAEHDGWLVWCSEIKGLLASGLIDATPDLKGIDHFFHFFAAGTTRTMFAGIKSIPPGHYLKVNQGRVERRKYWDLDFPDAGDERRLKDPALLVEELESLLKQSVRRRLRGDVPVVSYISGGLDSTMVLGLSSSVRGAAVPSFTIGLDKAGPDERTQSRESADALGSPLTTVTMNRSDIAAAYPELVMAAEGPVLDTSCACLLRLASAVHGQGYKVVLTGEGSDEALAGYVWFKAQKVRNAYARHFGLGVPKLLRRLMLRSVGGDRNFWPSRTPIGGARTAQQDLYDVLGQSRFHFYSGGMWDRVAGHSAYDDLDITNENFGRWDPLNQSLYVGYKVMLAGMLLLSKGDRIAMNSSVETRYPFLDDDVINFCAGIDPSYKLRGMTDKWLLRQVAARTLPKQIANRPKTMFRASLSNTFLEPAAPSWVGQLLSPESLRAGGFFDPELVARARAHRNWMPRINAKQLGLDMNLTSVVATQLWYHIFCGGGLCDLPTWTAPVVSSDDVERIMCVR